MGKLKTMWLLRDLKWILLCVQRVAKLKILGNEWMLPCCFILNSLLLFLVATWSCETDTDANQLWCSAYKKLWDVSKYTSLSLKEKPTLETLNTVRNHRSVMFSAFQLTYFIMRCCNLLFALHISPEPAVPTFTYNSDFTHCTKQQNRTRNMSETVNGFF